MKITKILRIVGILGAGLIFAHTIISIVKTFPYGGNPPPVTFEGE